MYVEEKDRVCNTKIREKYHNNFFHNLKSPRNGFAEKELQKV